MCWGIEDQSRREGFRIDDTDRTLGCSIGPMRDDINNVSRITLGPQTPAHIIKVNTVTALLMNWSISASPLAGRGEPGGLGGM